MKGPFVPKYKVTHPRYSQPDFIAAETREEAIEKFREKHGKIQTNHDYGVQFIAPLPTEGVVDINSIPGTATGYPPKSQHVVLLGLDPLIAAMLERSEIYTPEDIIACEELTDVPGIGEERAALIYAALDNYTNPQLDDVTDPS